MAPTNIVLIACIVSTFADITLKPSTLIPGTTKLRDSYEFFNEQCMVLVDDPCFKQDRLHDIWMNDFNWNTREVPFDILAFVNVTSEDIRLFKRDMGKLLVSQPPWHTATTIMVNQQQSRLQRKTMLFPVKGIPGRFIGVPNFRGVNPVVYIKKRSVFLISLQMLMMVDENHLIIMDCDTGETSLSHRDTLNPIYAPVIYQAAFRVPFGVRYSWLYTGEKIPDIPADHPPEPLFV